VNSDTTPISLSSLCVS